MLSSHRALVKSEADVAERVVRSNSQPELLKDVAVDGLQRVPILELRGSQVDRLVQQISVDLTAQSEGGLLEPQLFCLGGLHLSRHTSSFFLDEA